MAITNNGTKNSLPDSQIPSGYSRPSVTTFTDYEYERTLTLSVLKSTVESATRSTTMTNIIGNGTIGITKQITDILAAEFLDSATVTAYAEIIALTHNFAAQAGTDVWLSNTACSYVATVKLFIKSV
jgi:hypothetical protein